MRTEQSVQSQEQATRTAIDNFNEAFHRRDADGLAAFLTEDTVFETPPPLRTADASMERPPWSNSGAVGSSTIPTHASRPRN
jgi:ketosteroid isomerase-like protein